MSVAGINPHVLRKLIANPANAIEIGSAFAAGSSISLDDHLFRSSRLLEAVSSDCAEAGIHRVLDLIDEDFAQAKIQVWDGWVLSNTEGIICALFCELMRPTGFITTKFAT